MKPTTVQQGSSSGPVLATYEYDADGQRVHRTGVFTDTCDSAGVRDYVYDLAGHWILEVNNGGTYCKGEIYAGGRNLATDADGASYFDHSDWLGTVRLRNSYQYPSSFETCGSLPFGDALTCTGSDQSTIHFTGKERDVESGLDNFGARYNTSQMGRFMTTDRNNAGASATGPQSWNGYAYAGNNPLNSTDPDGLTTVACVDNGTGGQNCTVYQNTQDFKNSVANSSGVSAHDGQIFATVNGQQQQVGTYITDLGTSEDNILAPGIVFGAVGALQGGFRAGAGLVEDLLGLGARAAGNEAISGLYGTVTREALEAAANSGGSTVRVVTNLTQAPAAGRALSVAAGDGANALANAAREGGTTYVANIPKALLNQMMDVGLVQGSTTSMGGATAQELRFAPQAAEFVVKFFRPVQ